MKSLALAQTPATEATLTILNGPGRGTIYRLVSSRVRLGRGADNDIVINDDPKCSRNHAEILLSAQGIEVRDLTDRNHILVDGQECKVGPLQDNSVFVLGDTQFRFSLKGRMPTIDKGGNAAARSPHQWARAQSRKVKDPQTFRWIAIAAIVAIVWVGLSSSPKKDTATLTQEEQIQAEVKTANELKAAAQSRRPKDANNNVGYQQAQEAFVSGFRDYRKGQFERAMASFQACVSLYPSHALCGRYLRQAQRRFDEIIQNHMVLGRKYRDQNQYAACRSAFRNVMVMVKDPSSKRYLEAKANYEACQAQLEERF